MNISLTYMTDFFTRPGTSPQVWVVQLFAIVLTTLIIHVAAKILLNHYWKRHADKTKSPWDNALLIALTKPLGWLIWVYGICFAGDLVYAVSSGPIFELIPQVRSLALIILSAWFLTRFIHQAESNLGDVNFYQEPIDSVTLAAMSKLLRAAVIITAILIIMQNLGYSISGILAFGGIGGIAVGFAAKDLLANFFGGLMIYLDRPFAPGDWIRSPDREIEGTVENIGWRLTQIRTFDLRPLYVPNSAFTQITVENPSRMSNRRIYETIGIRYCDFNKTKDIVGAIKIYLSTHPEIDAGQTLIVNFNKFSDSSLDIMVYTFTRSIEWIKFHQIKQEILLAIGKIIEDHGAQIAFPTSTLHLMNDDLLAEKQISS